MRNRNDPGVLELLQYLVYHNKERIDSPRVTIAMSASAYLGRSPPRLFVRSSGMPTGLVLNVLQGEVLLASMNDLSLVPSPHTIMP